MNKKEVDVLFETNSGTVKFMSWCNKLRIYYSNIVWEQSISDFDSLKDVISNLNQYVTDVGQVYYRRFLINLKKYKLSLALNSTELKEMDDLLAGASIMLEWKKIINDSIKSK